jgi:hypothetical protein
MPRGVPGPVVKRYVKKTRKNTRRPDQIGGGKPGPGRPKGVRNKFTEELKQVILDGLHNTNDEGLFGFVRDTAIETPTAGLSILGRLIPVSLVGTLDGTIVVVHRDETAADSEPSVNVPLEQKDEDGEPQGK